MRLSLDDFSRSDSLRNAIRMEIAVAERSQLASETLQMREAVSAALGVHEKTIIDGCRRIFVDERVHALDLEILRKEDIAIRAMLGDLAHASKRHTNQITLLIEALLNRGVTMRPARAEDEDATLG